MFLVRWVFNSGRVDWCEKFSICGDGVVLEWLGGTWGLANFGIAKLEEPWGCCSWVLVVEFSPEFFPSFDNKLFISSIILVFSMVYLVFLVVCFIKPSNIILILANCCCCPWVYH